MFKRCILKVKLDIIKFFKGQRDGIFYIKMSRPSNMPDEEFEDIKNRLNSILDDIKKYI